MSTLKTYGNNVPSFVPSKTFGIKNDHIGGYIDGLEAFRQAVELTLTTERYAELIYSWDYGTEWETLIGERKTMILADAERRVEEALKQDDRFDHIEDFNITFNGDQANISFKCFSKLGNFNVERSVNIGD